MGSRATSSDLRHAAGLVLVAPLVAEVVASSNTPAYLFPVVAPLYAVIYGLPALLIRELWVRHRIGWPGFVLLGVAYAGLNEGVIAATWFKIEPDAKVLVFTAAEVGRIHGVNWTLVANLAVYHTIWSMLVPIVLMEAWSTRGRSRPWLGRSGIVLAVLALVFVLVGSLSTKATEKACRAPASVIFEQCADGRRVAALGIVAVVALALVVPRWRPRRGARSRPSDRVLWTAGIAYALAFLTSYFVLPLSGHPALSEAMAVMLFAGAIAALARWSRAPGWDLHAATVLATAVMVPGMMASVKAALSLQPLAVGLFVWYFLRPAHRRASC